MSTKLITAVLAAAVSLGALAPTVAFAESPKTKAACEKNTAMRWDDSSGKCVKR